MNYYRRLKIEAPERIALYQRRTRLKNRYGISYEEFEEMLASQGGACAICERSFGDYEKRPPIDHCHKTGRVRGILCHKCNGALGWFEKRSEAILSYIEPKGSR